VSIWSSIVASISIFLLGVSAFYFGTNGGQAWTAESARRLAVKSDPIVLPPFHLINQHGDNQLLFAEAKPSARPRLVFMEFIYTTCPTICLAMGAEFSRLQDLIATTNQGDKINLLSISFDPKDQSPQLASYLGRFAADPNIWSAANFSSDQQLSNIMNALGAIAIPDETLGFVHNAAVYVVRNGAVVAILEHDDHKGLQQELDRYLTAIVHEDI